MRPSATSPGESAEGDVSMSSFLSSFGSKHRACADCLRCFDFPAGRPFRRVNCWRDVCGVGQKSKFFIALGAPISSVAYRRFWLNVLTVSGCRVGSLSNCKQELGVKGLCIMIYHPLSLLWMSQHQEDLPKF
jgi:hypothetical protein